MKINDGIIVLMVCIWVQSRIDPTWVPSTAPMEMLAQPGSIEMANWLVYFLSSSSCVGLCFGF